MHTPTEPILGFFESDDSYLPDYLRDVSRHFDDLANYLCHKLPPSDERTMALRKLLEARDCAVRRK